MRVPSLHCELVLRRNLVGLASVLVLGSASVLDSVSVTALVPASEKVWLSVLESVSLLVSLLAWLLPSAFRCPYQQASHYPVRPRHRHPCTPQARACR